MCVCVCVCVLEVAFYLLPYSIQYKRVTKSSPHSKEENSAQFLKGKNYQIIWEPILKITLMNTFFPLTVNNRSFNTISLSFTMYPSCPLWARQSKALLYSRVNHNVNQTILCSTLALEKKATHWPTAGFLPEKCHGQRSLAGYSPWQHERAEYDLESKQQKLALENNWKGGALKFWILC